jgi:hypothetical protein
MDLSVIDLIEQETKQLEIGYLLDFTMLTFKDQLVEAFLEDEKELYYEDMF